MDLQRWHPLQTQHLIQPKTPLAAPVFHIQPHMSHIYSSIELCLSQLIDIAKQSNMALGITDQYRYVNAYME